MTRPATHLDLPEHERRGDEIARWNGYSIMSHPTIAKHLIAAVEAAQKGGLITDKDGIYERPEAEVLEQRLLNAQKRWDDLEAKYKEAISITDEFALPSKNDMYYINLWARENGLPQVQTAG